VLFIDFHFKHGIGEGFKNRTLNCNFIVFWHSILSLWWDFFYFILPASSQGSATRGSQRTRYQSRWTGLLPIQPDGQIKSSDNASSITDKKYKRAAVDAAAANYEL